MRPDSLSDCSPDHASKPLGKSQQHALGDATPQPFGFGHAQRLASAYAHPFCDRQSEPHAQPKP